MSLRTSIVVKQDATALSITGGSDMTLTNDGQGVSGANVLVDVSNGNIQTRKKLITRLVQPVPAVNSNALAKLGRSDLIMHFPFTDSNGKSYRCPANVSIAYHPEHTEAQRAQMQLDLLSCAADAELTPFFTKIIND
jgi:hypothetical protein